MLRGVVVAPIFTSSAWKWVASLSSCRTQRQLSRSCTGWSAASVSKRGFEAWPDATVMARRVVLAPHLSEESRRGHDGDRRHAAKHGSQRSHQAQGGRCSRKCNLLKKISPELRCESGTMVRYSYLYYRKAQRFPVSSYCTVQKIVRPLHTNQSSTCK